MSPDASPEDASNACSDDESSEDRAADVRSSPDSSALAPRASTPSLRSGERTRAVLLRGCESVRGVLEPHLGAARAMERANNIAQALALQEAEPDAVAFEMLRQLPPGARHQLAAAVRLAWLAAESDEVRHLEPPSEVTP